MIDIRRLLRLTAIALFALPPALLAGQHLEAAAPAVHAVEAPYVRLLPGSPFYDRQELHRMKFLAGWDPDRLLFHYRTVAGLPQADGAQPYSGWESGFIRGHMLGHYLSAASRIYAATGDEKYRDRANYIVAELAKCQAATGEDGYLAGFPSSIFDKLERGTLGPGGVLVPYYTVHKIIAGLLDVHHYLGNKQAVEIAVRMADYFQKRLEKLSPEELDNIFHTDRQRNPSNEFGGMGEALVDLSLVTGEARYLKLAQVFNRPWFVTPLAAGEDRLTGIHANTHIPQVISFVRYSEATGEVETGLAARHFWEMVTGQHSFANGGNGFREWLDKAGVETGPSIDGGKSLPPTTSESCGTYNMLKLTARLFEREPKIEYADYYERALYNHILATMNPDTGAPTYFSPMYGDFRTYLNGTFCCVASSLEYTPRFNEGIYYAGGDQLWINLYIPSSLEWSGQQIKLTEKGDVASGDETVEFTVTKSAAREGAAPAELSKPATLNFRVPYWVAGPAVLSVNGQEQVRSEKPSTYLSVTRGWKEGDVVKLTLPEALRIEHAKDSTSLVSIFDGPVLLAGELGRDGIRREVGDKDMNLRVPRPTVPAIVSSSQDPKDWLEPSTANRQIFKLKSIGPASGIVFRPLYDLHHQRYSVYWPLEPGNPQSSGADLR
jgi:uncharacterized protein